MELDQPLLIAPPLELAEGLDQIGDRGEVPDPEQVLLQGPDEALRDPVSFGLPDEARRAGHAEEGQLPLEVVAPVGAAMIVPNGQPCGDPLVEAAEVLASALAERLQRL